jgi:hypothetical protein
MELWLKLGTSWDRGGGMHGGVAPPVVCGCAKWQLQLASR